MQHYSHLRFGEKKRLVKLGIRYGTFEDIHALLAYAVGGFEAEGFELNLNEDFVHGNTTTVNPSFLISKHRSVGEVLCTEKFWQDIIFFPKDVEQLALAKSVDHVSYNHEYLEEREQSAEWEKSLYNYFDEIGVSYMGEAALQEMGSKVTPDVVLLDDCYIDGQLVRWIDCKSYYGSAQSSLFYGALRTQVGRYHEHLGRENGAVIFRLGHSDELARKLAPSMPAAAGALVLGQGPLRAYDSLS